MTEAIKATWANRLRKAASRTLGEDLGAADWRPERIDGFSDERGHRRVVDRYLLAWRGRAEAVVTEPPPPENSEARLWAALTHDTLSAHDTLPVRTQPHAPLFEQPGDVVIEVWTETELASLHALWWHAQSDGGLDQLVRDVGAWHVERMQPDNATNHPWGLHVFLLLHLEHGAEGADLYAQTLLHNCMVSQGKPDRLSAHILADSADAIERS